MVARWQTSDLGMAEHQKVKKQGRDDNIIMLKSHVCVCGWVCVWVGVCVCVCVCGKVEKPSYCWMENDLKIMPTLGLELPTFRLRAQSANHSATSDHTISSPHQPTQL